MQRFLPGIGALVEGHQILIVPVYIGGSFAAWPAGRRFPRFRPITVRFGKPIIPVPPATGFPDRRTEEQLAALVQAAVMALGK
jgi:1-acyl-sn-glycerol-3-phosphate acyltransferase